MGLLNRELPLTILDVGAALLEVPDYQKFLDANCARLIGFEPDRDARQKLTDSYGSPHLFFPFFLGDGGQAVFYETNWGPTGSLFEPNTPLLSKFENLAELVTPVKQHRVTTKRLDDLPEVGNVDFFKIDVQGGELAIFENASRVLKDAVLIQVEVNFLELYRGQPMFSDVDAFLRKNGFQFHDFVGFGKRPFKSLTASDAQVPYRQSIWSDAYYVKDWMSFDGLSAEKLTKLAVLLHDVVHSFDLAYVALQAADKKEGTSLAEDYKARLLAGEQEGAVGHGQVTTREAFELKTHYGVVVTVPASLDSITTYVLLEQEKWFEKELDFLLGWFKEGMIAIDVGANFGLYSLAIARRVGPRGHVLAYEPGTEARVCLEDSRLKNGLSNLTISACALADTEKEGWLQIASSSELNSLSDHGLESGNGERVSVSSLDTQAKLYGWRSIDFIKIDAEGQEARIIAGGREFFSQHSPLVMFEIKQGTQHNDSLRWMFQALGYKVFRLLGDRSCLVPFGSDDFLDGFELNLFAAKPDRAAALAEQGLLVSTAETFLLTLVERGEAIQGLIRQPFAKWFQFDVADIESSPCADALVAYAAARFLDLPSVRRYAALRAAFDEISRIVKDAPLVTTLSTFARIALDLGMRSAAVNALEQLTKHSEINIEDPFFPACMRFESIAPRDGGEAEWFLAAAVEQMALNQSFSSRFSSISMERLEWLCAGPFASPEIARRTILLHVTSDMPLKDLPEIVGSEHQHLNSTIWSSEGLSELLALR